MADTTNQIKRREALASAAACMAAISAMGFAPTDDEKSSSASSTQNSAKSTEVKNTNSSDEKGETMQIHYLEIVTKNVDAAIELHSAVHGVEFGEADPNLGGARTAKLASGGMLAVRAPMHDAEKVVTRAYTAVKDLKAAVAAAEKAGAMIAVPPMEIPGHGTIAVFIQDGIEGGFWQS